MGVEQARGVWTGSLDGAALRRLVDAELPRVAAPGTLLFVRQGTLFAQALAPDRQSLTGEPVPLLRPDRAAIRGFAVAGDTLIYRSSADGDAGRLVWLDRTGRPLEGHAATGGAVIRPNPALSPDGRHVALDFRANDNIDVWTMDAAC